MKHIKPYRPNVAAVIMSSEYPQKRLVLVAKRIDVKDVWQFPQGGIDRGERAKEALFRELKEEIGTDDIDIVAKYPKWLTYKFPSKIKKHMKPFNGQTQKFYLVRLKKKALINLQTKHPEFIDYKFVTVDEAISMATEFKKPLYQEVVLYFKKKGLL